MFTLETRQERGVAVYVLRGEKNGRSMEAWVIPEEGMNTARIVSDGQAVIDWDETRFYKGGTYGVPVLYPTPNKLPDGAYTFEGKDYVMKVRGQVIASHGLVRKEPFEVRDIHLTADSASITGVLEFKPGAAVYEGFPFVSELWITVTVTADDWRFDYKVVNLDEKDLPFGLALHPFFYRQGSKTVYRSDCDTILTLAEPGDEYVTTGRTRDPRGTEEDIRDWTNPDVLVQPSGVCYFGFDPEKATAEVWYSDSTNLKVRLSATKDFKYLVTFAPKDFPYFCLESQTCSADPINTYERGLEDAANLIVVKPGDSFAGAVTYHFYYGE